VPFAVVDGVELYFERHGESGEPLVLVHGFTGDVSDWRFQIAAFAPTHRVLALDNRGHGRSSAPREPSAYGIEVMAGDVERLAAHVGFERYHLVGHSLGGAVVQEIALRSPRKLLSLTLHDTAYRFNHRPFEPPEHPPVPAAERLQYVTERLARMAPEALLGCWNALQGWGGTEARLPGLSVRTLVICGERDSALIVDGSRRLAERIAGARLCMIAQAGHCPQEERPDAFNAALRDFLGCGG
jgi:pimeloyl-ACP methyl ester carboxylesterase